jgi:ribosomal-protein-alanine N-acetyltransferase
MRELSYDSLVNRRPQFFLRPLKITDAQSIYQHIKNREVRKYLLGVPNTYRLKDAVNFIRDVKKKEKMGTAYTFGIVLNDTRLVIGVISLEKIDKRHKNCELGCWLGRKYWNQGIMSEAVRRILKFAFEKLKMHRVSARVIAGNTGSVRVLENNNFRLEGVLFEAVYKNRYWHNLVLYGILKDDYQKYFLDSNQDDLYNNKNSNV